jgi:uncharacterized protein YjbJ (UPF0337 family)
MRTNIIAGKWNELRGKIGDWQEKLSSAQPIKAKDNHDEFVEILQYRYGYNKEKAESELEKHYSKIILTKKNEVWEDAARVPNNPTVNSPSPESSTVPE